MYNVHMRKDGNGKVAARLIGIPGRSPKQKRGRRNELIGRGWSVTWSGNDCLPKAGQCVSVADLVTRGLLLLSCLPREAINKEIMAEQFTQRLWVSLMPFKCANHFFHCCTKRKRNENEGESERDKGVTNTTATEIKSTMERAG